MIVIGFEEGGEEERRDSDAATRATRAVSIRIQQQQKPQQQPQPQPQPQPQSQPQPQPQHTPSFAE